MWSQKHDGSSTLLGSNRQGITEDVSYEPACKRTKFLPMVNSSGYDDEVLDINRITFKFLVTFKPNMSFVMNAYEFSDTDGTRVIVDCRRSRGCGIAFKRIFNHIKKKMQPLIYRDDYDWMKNAGLTRKN
ncbi:hypothetical protein ANCCEY_09706 [Ancylostoma ceylanicum]|uniref:Uncharacterized protein n=1 Tax=Ancylostoma ceylanicum TaxID=53326 RepID=A0A0D6LJ44_9BILA|nr:hypothetical protein ANCCEY_09706 [Ancylostoma ceylanicum]